MLRKVNDAIEIVTDDEETIEFAKQKQKDGNGIGMHVAKELIALNRGEFIFKPTVTGSPVSVNEILYSNNEVGIRIPVALR